MDGYVWSQTFNDPPILTHRIANKQGTNVTVDRDRFLEDYYNQARKETYVSRRIRISSSYTPSKMVVPAEFLL